MSLAATGSYLDRRFADIAAGRARPAYGMNFTARNARLPTHLAHAPLNILNGVHPYFGRSVGINVRMFYLAGRLAFTYPHLEDGCLESVNLMHWGEEGAEKLWMFIHPQFNAALTDIIRARLVELRKGEGDVFLIVGGVPPPTITRTLFFPPSS